MKKLLILPLLLLLTGCVTYYYPQTALQDGVYYAEDDPSYVVYSDSYAGVAYYPWSSLDYFYLGYNPYPRYGFGYGYGSGFSFGISYGYSPWYYPYSYYGYYSPWYASYYHYPYYPAWRPYHGYYSHYNRGHHKYNKGHRGGGRDRYAGNDNYDPRNRGAENEDRYENPDERRNKGSQSNSYSTSRVNRYVSTAPSGYSSNRGMVIRKNEATKTGKSRLEPTKSVPVQAVSVSPVNSRTAQSNYRTRQSGSEVRYSSGAKQGRSRTSPVESDASSGGIVVSAAQPGTVVATGNGGSRQSAPVKTSRQVSRPPTSGNSNRSRSHSQPTTSPSFDRRESKQGQSSRREHRK